MSEPIMSETVDENVGEPAAGALPAGSQDAVAQEVERTFKFNFVFNALDGASYWFGYSFFSPAIILPLFISRFTHNPIYIGLIPFFNTFFFLVPQMFTANLVKRAPRKKVFPVTLGFFTERMPILLLPVAALLFAKDQPNLALILTLALFAWYCLGAGLVLVGWQDMIAKVIPVDRRGRFFGITNFSGTASGILGALAVTWVLGAYDFPIGYVLSFTAAAILVFLSWIFLAQVREPAVPSTQKPVSQMEYLRSLPGVVKEDKNFSRFLVSQIVISLGGMAAGFLVVYPAQQWNMPDSLAGSFTIAMLVGQSLANLGFGTLADRYGHKLVLEIGALASVLSFGMALAAPASSWFYGVFFLRGITTAAVLLSGISIPLEFSSPEERPTYIGLANTIPGLASSLAPLFGGWLAGISGYPILFGLSGVIGILGLILLRFSVREPRHHQPVILSQEET